MVFVNDGFLTVTEKTHNSSATRHRHVLKQVTVSSSVGCSPRRPWRLTNAAEGGCAHTQAGDLCEPPREVLTAEGAGKER